MTQAVKENNVQRLTYTVPEIAQLMGLNVITAYELAKRKDFPAVRIGRRIIVPREAFYRWLDGQAAKQ
jgi:excisionase family DNA binding protein